MKLQDRVAVAEAGSGGLQPQSERLTLRELRARRDLTIRQLEAEVGISRGTLSQIETGARVPTPAQLHQLSEFYGVAADGWRFVVLATVEVEA
jgi:transcriptional regulator with XRE-family HTH domain